MNIPSNYKLDQILKYYPSATLEQVEKQIDEVHAIVVEQSTEIALLQRQLEIAEEQVYFRQEWIENLLQEIRDKGNKGALVKYIKESLANSYIEL